LPLLAELFPIFPTRYLVVEKKSRSNSEFLDSLPLPAAGELKSQNHIRCNHAVKI